MKKLQSNEFRLWNLVKYEGKVYAIDSISKEFPTLNTIEFGIGVVDWDNIEPILLTEEWLVKFGFNKESNGWKTISICEEISIGWEYWAGVTISVNGESFMLNHIRCIHHLQNLYFALTNQELTLQP
jgi:hypothetical protein